MRFFSGTSLTFALTSGSAIAETCQSFCDRLDGCKAGDHTYGSYCKSYQDPEVCFGLYWLDETETAMCFQPDSLGACPETRPVRCPSERSRCEEVCQSTEGCGTDKHGSYCKHWQVEPVCFGLYYKDASKTSTCFEPFDLSCPSEFPVGCEEDDSLKSTTVAPTTIAVSSLGSVGPFSTVTTVAPVTVKAAFTVRTGTAKSAVSTTNAPTTSTSTTEAPVNRPNGKYVGSAMGGVLSMTATFTPGTVDIVFSFSGASFTGPGIPYVMVGSNVELAASPALDAFLAKVPMKLSPSDITISFEASSNQVSGSFKGFKIVGSKVA